MMIRFAAVVLLAASTVLLAQASQATAPALSAAERAEGWRLLFDGATTKGWRGFKKPAFPVRGWAIESGTIKHLASGGAPSPDSGDIITTDVFDDFDLRFEWRVVPGANSGVKYFVTEDREGPIAHEYQVIDDERHPDAKIGVERQTAAFYDVLEPKDRKLKPAGEWNTGRIVATGPTVEHWLNGGRVLSFELDSPALRAAIADSKFKGVERFGKMHKGHILIQDHGDQVWYRAVRIRSLANGSH